MPNTDIAKWDFKVFGAVEHELTLDYGELRALPSIWCGQGLAGRNSRWIDSLRNALALEQKCHLASIGTAARHGMFPPLDRHQARGILALRLSP